MVKYLGRAVGYVKSLTSKKAILALETRTATFYSRKGHQKGTWLTKHRHLQTGDLPKCYF
ncbi:hypothetical protein M407DRAFT_247093 [Tulasnella calospora MUT 4182]|uniref:Uncharacterized protein n=1 Tax=Tulasnella calospora MUT 4182 TaxID=1051891 RepID=A0A0C3Q1F7_9AGAM|nr:hypothetical protein M407DRAFT_247093 [Tulasnella calospora MUT 4182]